MNVLNLFFWNLAQKNRPDLVVQALNQFEVDIAAFAEADNVDLNRVVELLDNSFCLVDTVDGAAKTALLVKSGIEARESFSIIGNLACTLNLNGDLLNLAVVHLPDLRNDPDGFHRERIIQRLVRELATVKKYVQDSHNIYIGDFNCNPFDSEMVKIGAMNSTFYRSVATRIRYRKSDGEVYPITYNPALEYLSEANLNQGSFYRVSGDRTYYWYCLDQVVVDWELADCIDGCRYVRRIGDTELISGTKPYSEFSDHLPLLVSMDMEGCYESKR